MSTKLIDRSPDLARLREEGYDVAIVHDSLLLVRSIPYLKGAGSVDRGTLIVPLELHDDATVTPSKHVVHFDGEFPHNLDGSEVAQLKYTSGQEEIARGLSSRHRFSHKPMAGYSDYHELVTAYIGHIMSGARDKDSSLTACVFPVAPADPDEESPFLYADSASARAGVISYNERLSGHRVGIVGLGGTGAYVLDLVSKTKVAAIDLWDGDRFLQHNAFRAPGATSAAEMEGAPNKATFYEQKYSRMRRGIRAVPRFVDESNVTELAEANFVFICIDRCSAKALIFSALRERGIPFIDVGMGLTRTPVGLTGQLRVTACTPGNDKHLAQRVSMVDNNEDAAYDDNIQIADLNALNAALAVIRWKRLFGFYADLEHEFHSIYSIPRNFVQNEDQSDAPLHS